MKKKLVGLVDADFIKYFVAHDLDKLFKISETVPIKTLNSLIHKRVKEVQSNTKSVAKDLIFLFSGPTGHGYRSKLAAERKYKDRKYTEKFKDEALYKNLVEEYIMQLYNSHKEMDLEADDLCTMAHTEGTFIYSYDKDLRNSPGIHFDLKTKELITISEDEAFLALLKQCIQGDSTDTIPGLLGVGKLGAGKAINVAKTPIEAIQIALQLYLKSEKKPKDGFDKFVEMYSLVNLKTSRGNWTKERYSEYFNKINELIKK